MPIPPQMESVILSQLALVLNIDNPEVVAVAKKLAYYVAMLDHALDDPLADEQEQEVLVDHLATKVNEITTEFQTLVDATV